MVDASIRRSSDNEPVIEREESDDSLFISADTTVKSAMAKNVQARSVNGMQEEDMR